MFHVTVNGIAKLKSTRFLAFGDSITLGENGDDPLAAFGIFVVDDVNNYPTVLAGLLRDRYQSQAASIVVQRDGVEGERVFCKTGESGCLDGQERFAADVNAFDPDVVLLLEGANDVNSNVSPSDIAGALRADVLRASRSRPRLVIVSTLLPQIEGSRRGTHPGDIAPANSAIVPAVTGAGAMLVDAYAAFNPQKQLLLSADGLHPNVAGFKLLADLFFAAIKTTVEQPLPPGTPAWFARPGLTRGLTSASPGRPGAPAAVRRPADPSLRPR